MTLRLGGGYSDGFHGDYRRHVLTARSLSLILLLVARAATAQLTGYSYLDDEGTMVLTSVSIQSGDATRVYDAKKLVPVQVVDFAVAPGPVGIVPSGSPIPDPRPGRRCWIVCSTAGC